MRAGLRLIFLPAAACCWLAQGAVADQPADLHSFPSIVSAYEDLCIDRRSGDLRGLRLYVINAADRLFVLAQPAGGVLAEPLPATDLQVHGGRISFAVPAATLRPAMAFDGAYVPAAIEGVLSTIQDNGDATTRSVKLRRVTDAAQGFPDCRPPQPAVTASASSSSGVDQRANLPAPPTCSSREQLVGIAASYVARHWPSESDETSTLKPILFDRGKVWEVLYELPPGTLGGTPVMLIDKITCTVVSSIHEQ